MMWQFIMDMALIAMKVGDSTQVGVPGWRMNGWWAPEQVQAESEELVVNVTAEDLQRAGYNSNKTPWAEEEDALLKKLRDEDKLDWAEIAYKIPGRNSKMCYSRYRRLENQTKEIWRKADDQLLIELVAQHGEDWKGISRHFQKRTPKQIKEHFINYLRPDIKREDWTLEEDLLLVRLLNTHGKNWKAIEEILGNRTQNQIKNRYFGRLKRISDRKLVLRERQPAESALGETPHPSHLLRLEAPTWRPNDFPL